MDETEKKLINDHLFHQAVSCPLKYQFITEGDIYSSSRPVYRQRNKLHLRDAVSLRFSNCKHTSDNFSNAEKETKLWLQENKVAVCGAVLRSGNLLTRVPILVKNHDRFTIIQIHGKLRKLAETSTIIWPPKNRPTAEYLMKAAWRMEVLKRVFPNHDVQIKFYFPNKHFKATADGLNRFKFPEGILDQSIKENLLQLFSGVDATESTHKILKTIPETVSHREFSGQSVAGAAEKIQRMIDQNLFEIVAPHDSCKHCQFRKSQPNEPGCWQTYFTPEHIRHPNRHIYELIGHGNSSEATNGIRYQEELTITDGMNSFEKIQKYSGKTISNQHRRDLQILQVKGEKVPSLWMKPAVKILQNLPYPLHFIDFEAATYALPMKKGSGCYDPVYFQFSCHSLDESGKLSHHEWLDDSAEPKHPHEKFADKLGSIPEIFEGTIVQYSPFEKQAINNLINEFRTYPERYETQIQMLEAIRNIKNGQRSERFVDLNKVVRNSYYNCFMKNGLGLKQVLISILKWEKEFGDGEQDFSGLAGKSKETEYLQIRNPYELIQQENSAIMDGSTAMNAWIAMKNGLLNEDEKHRIPRILKKYCALDSFALYVIFRHLNKFSGRLEHGDKIIL